MRHLTRAMLALALTAGLAEAAVAQSMATPGPTPDSWLNAVPGPVGPTRRYTIEGYGSSAPPSDNRRMISPDNPQAPLGAGGFTTGGQYYAR